MMDGPRTARPEDLPNIIDLAEHVFAERFGRAPYMARMFPFFLSAANLDNLYVVCDQGRVASFLGIDLRTLVTAGCRLPAALVGAVCTHEDYAGRRLSGQTLALAYRRSRDKGAIIACISGGRTVYLASGAERVWPLHRFEAAREQLAQRSDASLEADPITASNLDRLVALHGAEPVRFEWTPEWLAAVPPRLFRPDLGHGYLVRRGGRPVAALCFRAVNLDKREAELLDWFGDRRAALAALAAILDRLGASGVSCRFVSHDTALVEALAEAGIQPQRLRPSHWTLKVLDFAALLAALRGRLERALGDRAGAIAAHGNGIRIALGGEEYVSPDERTAAQILFALPDEYAEKTVDMPAAIRQLVGAAFPVPLRHYGMNYI